VSAVAGIGALTDGMLGAGAKAGATTGLGGTDGPGVFETEKFGLGNGGATGLATEGTVAGGAGGRTVD